MISGRRSHPAIAIKKDGNILWKKADVAEALAGDFSTRGNNQVESALDYMQIKKSKSPWYNKNFTLVELRQAVNSGKSTTPGPDNIPYDFIQQLDNKHFAQLLSVYNYYWNTGLPEQWRHSVIIPIQKPGKDPATTSAYRPIALSKCMCKVM